MYFCLDNPILLAVAGVPNENIKVEAKGADIVLSYISEGFYMAKVSKEEPVQIILSDKKTGKIYANIPFRVIAYPNATAQFSPPTDTRAGLFFAFIPAFDMDLRCEVVGYNMAFIPSGRAPQIITCIGNKLDKQALAYYLARRENDNIYVYDIMVNCPCYAEPRRIPLLNLKI